MSKTNKALQRAVLEKELRQGKNKNIIRPYEVEVKSNEEGKMKNSWLVWIFIVGVIATVVIAFNYERGKNTVPLSEIFKEEQAISTDVEFEIVKSDAASDAQATATTTAQAATKTASAKATSTTQAAQDIVLTAPQEKITETQSAASSAPSAPAVLSAPFTIQVGSFKEKSKAQKIVDLLQSKGYLGQVVARNLGDQGTWNRVYVGQFNAKSEADSYLKKIQDDFQGKVTGFVISPQKAK